jgi:hypothetical protein
MSELVAPHCDPSILHSPSADCWACNERPDWQAYRQLAGIAFTGDEDECGVEPRLDGYRQDGTYEPGKAPCPSTWFREPRARDAWGPNRAQSR